MEFIGPLIEKAIEVVAGIGTELLGELPAFASVGRMFTGVVENFPAAWVMAATTEISDETTGMADEVHTLVVKIAVSSADAEELPVLAMAYVRAVHRAIAAVALEGWNWWADMDAGGVRRVHIARHKYGPAWQGREGLAIFPEVWVDVETSELEEE